MQIILHCCCCRSCCGCWVLSRQTKAQQQTHTPTLGVCQAHEKYHLICWTTAWEMEKRKKRSSLFGAALWHTHHEPISSSITHRIRMHLETHLSSRRDMYLPHCKSLPAQSSSRPNPRPSWSIMIDVCEIKRKYRKTWQMRVLFRLRIVAIKIQINIYTTSILYIAVRDFISSEIKAKQHRDGHTRACLVLHCSRGDWRASLASSLCLFLSLWSHSAHSTSPICALHSPLGCTQVSRRRH